MNGTTGLMFWEVVIYSNIGVYFKQWVTIALCLDPDADNAAILLLAR